MTDLKRKIMALVSEDLDRIETALAENLSPYLELVRKTAGHIMYGGGKRLRPLLMVLSARLCGAEGDRIVRFSTIFEYLHTATLLHDDLVDEAVLRRGKTAAHLIYGNSVAVLVGDFLLARALSIASQTGSNEVIATVADMTENLSQGELEQLQRKGDLELTEAEYMEVIRRKTAVLFQGACRVSGLVADASPAAVEALAGFGFHLGLAFQMVDDLLDYTADTADLGKEIGADLKEGKLTLPVIHTLTAAGSQDRRRIEEVIRKHNFTRDEFCGLVKLLNQYGGISHTRQKAAEHVQKAKDALAGFQSSPSRDILLMLADYALIRHV